MLDWLRLQLGDLVPLDHLRALEAATGAPAWLMLTTATVMFLGWTGCYIAIIRQGFRDRAYGIPIVNTALNISWEFIFAFEVFGPLPAFYFPLQWGHRLWLALDVFNVYQIFKYGKALQIKPWLTRNFYPVVTATFLGAGPGIYLFMSYFNDVNGVATAMLIDLLMAVLFIGMIGARPGLRGLSLPAAWMRAAGDIASYVFCYFWWPAQFIDGLLVNPDRIARFDNVHEPQSFLFLNCLYVVIAILDVVYIRLLVVRRRAIKAQGPRPKA